MPDPKWLVIFGLVLAFTGELSALSLVIPKALFFISLSWFPIGIYPAAAGELLLKSLKK